MLRLWIAPPTLTTLEEALKILIVINKMEKVLRSITALLAATAPRTAPRSAVSLDFAVALMSS